MSFEIHRVASGKSAAAIRSRRVLIVRARLVSQTIFRSGGTFRRASSRCRQVCGGSDDGVGLGLI